MEYSVYPIDVLQNVFSGDGYKRSVQPPKWSRPRNDTQTLNDPQTRPRNDTDPEMIPNSLHADPEMIPN